MADQAYARFGGPDGMAGQVILFRDGGACLGLTPLHVMNAGFGMPASLIRRERVLLDGFAVAPMDLGRDLALVSVRGAVAERCGPPLRDRGDSRARIDAAGGQLMMRSITANGATLFRPVHMRHMSDIAIDFEEIGEGADNWAVAPGDSGSALMLGDEIVGIVQEQGNVNEMPRALLWSHALYLADWRHPRQASLENEPLAPSLPPIDGLRVERTTTLTLSPETGADRLTAPLEEGGYWQAETVEWPVQIDIALAGIRGVAGLVFHPAPETARGHPRTVEILTTRTEEGENGWESFDTFTLSLDSDPRSITLGSGRMLRRMRVSVYDTWSDGDEIALGRIEVYLVE